MRSPARSPARSFTPLPRAFYARPVLAVARECIGKLLVHDTEQGLVGGRIVEVEAYRGPEDAAAHSHRGRHTERNHSMWGPAGHAYVFFVYGMHFQFNLVTGQLGEPHALLVRALEPTLGIEIMAKRRGQEVNSVALTNGPGKLCQALGIRREHDGVDLCQVPLFLLDAPRVAVERSPRIGIDYAGVWAEKPWRFSEPGNPFVSKRPSARKRTG